MRNFGIFYGTNQYSWHLVGELYGGYAPVVRVRKVPNGVTAEDIQALLTAANMPFKVFGSGYGQYLVESEENWPSPDCKFRHKVSYATLADREKAWAWSLDVGLVEYLQWLESAPTELDAVI